MKEVKSEEQNENKRKTAPCRINKNQYNTKYTGTKDKKTGNKRKDKKEQNTARKINKKIKLKKTRRTEK